MIPRRKLVSALIFGVIVVLICFSVAYANVGLDRNRTNGCSCHNNPLTNIPHINTNITGNIQDYGANITIGVSASFDISITLAGLGGHSVPSTIAWVFWHGSATDGMGQPIPLGTAPAGTATSWTGANLMYQATWTYPAIGTYTRIFRITVPSTQGVYIMWLRGVGCDSDASTRDGTPLRGGNMYILKVTVADTTPPGITLTSVLPNPSNGLTTITVTNTTADFDASGVRANVSAPTGWIYPALTYQGSNQWRGTFSVTANGIYTVRVNATDKAGNKAYAGPTTVTGDIVPPSITLMSVLPNPSNGLTTIMAQNASADIDTNGILANISTPSGGWIYRILTYTGGNIWTGTFTVTQDGTYIVRINATDKASNTGYAGPQSITSDITAPIITLGSVTPNPSKGLTTIQVINASSDINTNGILANISTPSGSWIYRALTYTGGNIWTSAFTVTQDGTYTVRVNATDYIGNIAYDGPISIQADLTAPTIILVSVIPNPSRGLTTIQATNMSTDINANGILANISTPSGGWLYLSLTYQGFNTWTGTFTVTESGIYTVRLNATDKAGNTGYAGPQSITGDKTPPSITLVSVLPNPSNGLTTITAQNASADIDTNGILANISTPSGGWIYRALTYTGGNTWTGIFTVTQDGTYTVRINATDKAGNTGYAGPQSISSDVTAPIITLVSVTPNPSNGLTAIQVNNASNDINVNGILANISTPSGGWIYRALTYTGGNTWTGIFTVTQDGTYSVRINATDFVGNTGYNGPQSIVSDVMSPTITIVSVTPNPSRGLTTIQATNASTDINANGILANVSTPSGGWLYLSLTYLGFNTWTGTFTVTESGTYTVRLNATDKAGNTGYAGPQSITGDKTPPSITLVSVLPNPSNGLTTITVQNASADIGTNGILANISTPSGGWIYRALTYTGGNTWTGIFTVIQDGTHTVRINATDFVGNTGYNGPQSIIADVTPPTIILISMLPNPSNGLTIITAQNASTDINIKGILANISTPSGIWLYTSLTYQSGNIWNGSFIVTEDGPYIIRINATDHIGNTGYHGPQSITGDVISPQIDITYPANDGDQIGGGTISISGTADGTGSNILNIYINDSRWGLGQQPQTNPSGTQSGFFNFNNNTIIPIGDYWVAINITDAAGNTNVSIRYFKVISGDVNPPDLTITSINPNPSNGFTVITVISYEDLIGVPLLNITAPNSSIYYRSMYPIGGNTWRTNFTVFSTGNYIIRVNGSDMSSNIGYKSGTLIGDTTPPVITLVSVLPNPSNGVTTITAQNGSSDINANGIRVNISTPTGGWIYRALTYIGGNTWTSTFAVTTDGTYTVRINATDTAGNIGYGGPQSIIADVTSPSITLVSVTPSPSNGLTTIRATNASSDINANGIRANISIPAGWLYGLLTYIGNNTWTATFMVTQNGLYTVRINATDKAGNTRYAGPQSIMGDITAPSISLLSILPNPSSGGTVITAQNASSDINTNGIMVNISTPGGGWLYAALTYVGLSFWTGTFMVTESGVYTVRINATDKAGNTGYAGPQSIIGDKTPPSLILVSVLPNPSNGVTTITAQNASSDINAIGIRANVSTPTGWLYRSLTYIGGTTWTATFTVTADGTYTVRINATDKAGNTGYAGPQSIIGDKTPPSLILVSVLPNPSNGVTTIIAQNGSSDINANSIRANISTPTGWLYRSLTYTGGNTWTGTFIVTQDGVYTVRINATDLVGNTGYAGPQIIMGDVSAPSISLFSIIPNPSGGMTTITAQNASTDINMNGILVNISTPSGSWLYVALNYLAFNQWTGTFTVTESGIYTVRINATDKAGNTGYTGPQSIIGDMTPPSITLVSVLPNPSNGVTTITVQNASSDINANSIWANISTPTGGWIYRVLTFIGGNTWTSTFTVTADGTYTVRINATDKIGNIGYDGPLSIIGDVSPPTISIISILPIISRGLTIITAQNLSTDININGILANISTPSGGWLYLTMNFEGGTTWTGTFIVTEDGAYTIRINTTDLAGNTGYNGPQSITGDFTPPIIAIHSPIALNVYNGTISIAAAINDLNSPIDNNSVYAIIIGPTVYNSGRIDLIFSGGSYTSIWNSRTGSAIDGDGNYIIRIYANDTVKNQQSNAITFVVDNLNVDPNTNTNFEFQSIEGTKIQFMLNANVSGTILLSLQCCLLPPQGTELIGIFINITFIPQNSGAILGINKATLNITLTPAKIASIGDVNFTSLKIYHYDPLTQTWTALNTVKIGNTFSAEVTSLSSFGLLKPIVSTDSTLILLIALLVAFGIILSVSPKMYRLFIKEKPSIRSKKLLEAIKLRKQHADTELPSKRVENRAPKKNLTEPIEEQKKNKQSTSHIKEITKFYEQMREEAEQEKAKSKKQ